MNATLFVMTDDEITAAAIARWAGVGRAAVSNWRRRYTNFPRPVGGSEASPRFSRIAVGEWLTATGKANQLSTAGSTDTGTHRISDDVTSADNWSDDKTPDAALSQLTSGQLLAQVMVSLLPEWIAPHNPVASDDANVPIVLDPACAGGTVLAAVADLFGDRVALVGQDIDEEAASEAALLLRGRPDDVRYDVQSGDSFLDNRFEKYLGEAAAVVCEPPLGQSRWPMDELATDPRWEFGIPSARESELAWVQHCYAHLRPGGVAVVMVSMRTCMQSSGQHIRAALVRAGVLRDVIALPSGLGSLPDTDLYVWVLQKPIGHPEFAPVRMTDLSGLADPADVPDEITSWKSLFSNAGPTVCRSVDRVELLDGDTILLPSRYVTARIDVGAGDLASAADRLERLYEQIGRGLPRFGELERPAQPSTVTIGELERVGALKVRPRDTVPRGGDVLLRTLARPPIVATGSDTDESGVAQVVELDLTRLDPHFVATFLRVDANALPVSNTLGSLSREDLRRCRIPRLPLPEQQRYGDAFRHLHDMHGAVSALAKVTAKVIDQTVYGLTVGALSPDLLTMTNHHSDNSSFIDGEKRKQ
ncbi:N-6 DNA Methylase [Rhodococcus erythropolis SK121]|nr:N-6 DNA Methylase [Rhodococcus erythropolis SK121]